MSDAMALHLSSALVRWLLAQAAAPDEVCGVLLGRRAPVLAVEQIVAGRNLHATPATHFLLDAATLLRADAMARAAGLTIIGFYHSHPRGAALPSSADRREAWPDAVQAIIGVTRSGARHLAAWRVTAAGAILPLPLRIAAPPRA